MDNQGYHMSGRGQQLTERPAARLSEPARNYDACANLTLGYSVVTDRRTLEKIYQAKELQRKRLAQLPFHEKIRILVTIQKRADGIIRSRNGSGRIVWKLPSQS